MENTGGWQKMIEEISIRYLDTFTVEKPENPILIEGLPGIGQVGKLVAEYMIHMLGAEKIGEIHSIYFPPQERTLVLPGFRKRPHLSRG
jgi:proteasome assembly chaperone (PAC2) family protein